MRDARARAEEALDDVSANLGEVLRRADALLAEWSAFGAAVRAQVEREAASVGDAVGAAVANAVDGAVSRSVGASVERAVPEQLGARMAGLTAELAKLEHRARTAAKSISDDRVHDRRLLGGLVIGVLVANALLVLVLLRTPQARVPSPQATRVVEPALAPSPRAAPMPANDVPAAQAGQASGTTPAPDRKPGSPAATPASEVPRAPETSGSSVAPRPSLPARKR